jgi:hypothetical protein
MKGILGHTLVGVGFLTALGCAKVEPGGTRSDRTLNQPHSPELITVPSQPAQGREATSGCWRLGYRLGSAMLELYVGSTKAEQAERALERCRTEAKALGLDVVIPPLPKLSGGEFDRHVATYWHDVRQRMATAIDRRHGPRCCGAFEFPRKLYLMILFYPTDDDNDPFDANKYLTYIDRIAVKAGLPEHLYRDLTEVIRIRAKMGDLIGEIERTLRRITAYLQARDAGLNVASL